MILPYLGRAFANLFRKPATEKFPLEDAPKAQPNYRGRIAYDPNLCINCGLCSRVCAPQAITRTIKPLPNGDSEITLTFDMTSCTFCGTCADFCVKHAIKMTDDYMIVGTKPEDFLVSGTFIKKKPAPPKFTPEQIAAMKAAAEKKRQAAQNAAAGAQPAGDAAKAAPASSEATKPAAPADKPAEAAAKKPESAPADKKE